MICKYCNTENSDDAKFCRTCGQPLSGTICPVCQTYNAEGAVFCRNCGTRLDGKRICAKCGAILEEQDAFCPQCGEKYETNREKKPEISSEKKAEKPSSAGIGFRKGMHIAAIAMSICLSAIAIIFTVFMGCKASSTNLTVDDILDPSTQSAEQTDVNLFFYFQDAWKALDGLTESTAAYNATVYIQIILGLLFCAASLILVLVFSVMSIIRNINAIKKKSTASGLGLSLNAFCTFLVGAIALLFLHSSSLGSNLMLDELPQAYRNLVDRFTSVFNEATVAGFALGGVCLALMVIFEILSKGKELLNKKYILNASLSLGGAILMTILIALFAQPLVTLSIKLSDYIRLWCGYGPYALFAQGGIFVSSTVIKNGATIMTLSGIGFVLCCLALSMGAVYFAKSIQALILKDQSKDQFIFSLVVLVAAVANLVVTILANNFFSDALTTGIGVGKGILSFSYAIPIAMLVLSALALGIEIARKAISTSSKTQAAKR